MTLRRNALGMLTLAEVEAALRQPVAERSRRPCRFHAGRARARGPFRGGRFRTSVHVTDAPHAAPSMLFYSFRAPRGGAAQIRRPRSGVACAASADCKLGWPCSPARVRAHRAALSVGRRMLGLLTAGMGTREVQAMVSKLTLFSQSEGPQTCGTAARERGRLGWAVGCFRTDTLLGVLSSGRAGRWG